MEEKRLTIDEKLTGKKATFFCMNYIYTGVVASIDERTICIKEPAIVYETGPFVSKEYKDVQSLCVPEFFINRDAIESFGILK